MIAFPRVRLLVLCVALAGSGLLAIAPPHQVAAASSIIYVDGKIGQDPPVGPSASSTWGRSTTHPFKTVKRALEETRFWLPQAIRIKGYADYVYHETITHAYRLVASAGSPLVIGAYTAAEDPAAAGVRPIIDGGINVGKRGWRRPNASRYPHVWCKTWRPPGSNLVTGQKVPPGYDSKLTKTRQDRFYFDTSQPLNRPSVAPSRAKLNARPYSQYWDASRSKNNLCVHLGRWNGKRVDENPAHHRIVLPWYRGIVLAGGSRYVTIRDLRIRHTIMGVGISVSKDPAVGKAHHITVYNVDASYNYRMGFWTAGDDNTFDHISGSRNSIQLVKLDTGTYKDGTTYGAKRNVITHARSIQNLSHGVKLYGKKVTHNHVLYSLFDNRGIPRRARSADQTQAVQISNGASFNEFRSNVIRGGYAGFELYQYDSRGGPLEGNVISDNNIRGTRIGVFLWDNRVSRSFGTGATTFSNNTYYKTQNAIGGNGTTSGKVFDHETIYHTGFKIGPKSPTVDKGGVELSAGSITIRNSIIDDTNGPSICPKKGAKVYLSYTDTYRWRNDPRRKLPHGTYCHSTASYTYGVVKVGTGVVHVDPGYSRVSSDPDFLVVPNTSPLYHQASDGKSLGAL